MAFQKMGNFTFKHIDQTDELGLTADEAKEKFDSRGEELKTALNNAVDALNATADGNSGADNVGATAVEGWPGSSVQAILESAKSDIAGHKAAAAVQAHLAKNIAIEDTEGLFTATHVEGALGELFTSVSNGKNTVAAAITDKGVPTSGSDSFSQMANNIDSIVLGSGNAVEADVLSGKTFSNDSGTGKVGTMPNRGAVSQSLAINGSYTIPQGYHNGAGQVTQSIPAKGAQTYTPGTTNQVIAAGQYLSGVQTIAGSENLIAANIRDGINVFGVVGTLQEGTQFITYNSPAMTIGNNVAQDTVFWTFSIPSRPKYLSFERVYNLTGTEANHFYIDSLSEFPWSYLDGLSNVQFNYANIFGPPNPIQYDNSEFFLFYVQNYSDTTAEYRVSIGINLIGGTTITFKKKESAIYSQTWDLPAGAWKIHAGF